ncbi:TetR/AcrR family transcriptional regulator [Actinomadura flavalba]|uniref:TetR/AcrR family transcriptional regulator n=1 Tax=Actinomadura flavalba TaxID=1120938 RepID=UPI0003651D89|nr:TetR/AcrR family transcriptional regulator [Actinomadura flavalba]
MGQRDDLLRGAKLCLSEKGYAHTTARDIAAASGAHLASIGYHFGSKDNLMTAAVLEATGEWGDRVETAARRAGGDTAAERFLAMLDEVFRAIPGDRPLLVAGVQAYVQAQFSEEVRSRMEEALSLARRELAAIALGVPADEVDEADVQGLGALAYATLTGFVLSALIDPGALPSRARLAAALDAVTRRPARS